MNRKSPAGFTKNTEMIRNTIPLSAIMNDYKIIAIFQLQISLSAVFLFSLSFIQINGGYMDQQNLPGTVTQDVSVGEWIITILITAIPLVGLIMLFVWAFGDAAPPSKKNWAIATLIWYAIIIVLSIIFFGVFISIIGSMFGELNTYS
jgi:hypothetical protein